MPQNPDWLSLIGNQIKKYGRKGPVAIVTTHAKLPVEFMQ
jgi:hypothetical protein